MNSVSNASNPSIVSPEPIPTTPSSVSTRTIVTGKAVRGTGIPGRRERRIERDPQAIQPDRGDAHVEAVSPTRPRCGTVRAPRRATGRATPAGGSQRRWSDEPIRRRSSSSTTSRSATTPPPARAGAKRGTPGAVNDLSLVVPAGKICILVGPSGCGKTTSLKMVNRLIEPTSGQILIDGVDAATRELTELRRSIGYVIQQVGLFPHQTIGDNVATVPRLLGWPKARQQERSEELLGLVGLDPAKYRDRFPSQLSGGERQRVGVARALAADPPIMLMDEPFGAVDPIVRDRLQNEFLRLQETIAKTILFVTHDIDEAIKMGDLVAVFQTGGILAQFGPPLDILAAPGVRVRRPLRRPGPRPQAPVAAAGVRRRAPAGRHRAARRPAARRPARRAADDPLPLRPRRRRGEPAARLGRPRRPAGGWRRDRGDGQPGLADRQQADDPQGRAVDDARRRRPDRHRRRPDGRRSRAC